MKNILYLIGLIIGVLYIVKRFILKLDNEVEEEGDAWVNTQLASVIAKNISSISEYDIYKKLKKKDYSVIPKEYNRIILQFHLFNQKENNKKSIKKTLIIYCQNGDNISIEKTIDWLSLPSSIRREFLANNKPVQKNVFPISNSQ